MNTASAAATDLLHLDAAAEIERIMASIRESVFERLKRRGAVVGLSGGVDSTLVAYLCAHALGKERVVALLMPEADSSPDSLRLGRLAAEELGIRYFVEDISPALRALRCYERRDDAIRTLIPEYGGGWKMKIVLPGIVESPRYTVFSLVAQSPAGEVRKVRLSAEAYLAIVAATNFKQRVRKMLEYHYADRFVFAVAGTPNRLEYDQGFFVKNGDGAADLKPIAHLYKSQVYQLAEHLGIPAKILQRTPTTDTYSLEQTQQEFYFSVPLATMDLCLYGHDHGIPASELAASCGLNQQQVERVWAAIESKRKIARYLHAAPLLVEPLNI